MSEVGIRLASEINELVWDRLLLGSIDEPTRFVYAVAQRTSLLGMWVGEMTSVSQEVRGNDMGIERDVAGRLYDVGLALTSGLDLSKCS